MTPIKSCGEKDMKSRIGRGALWWASWVVLLPLAVWSVRSEQPLSILLIGPLLFCAFWQSVQFCLCPQCKKKIGRITAKTTHCPFCGSEAWLDNNQKSGDTTTNSSTPIS
jgi:hypothetical protein